MGKAKVITMGSILYFMNGGSVFGHKDSSTQERQLAFASPSQKALKSFRKRPNISPKPLPIQRAMPTKRSCHYILSLLTVSFLSCVILCGCGDSGPTDEEKALAIYRKARELRRKGLTLEALQEYDRLADFKETRAFQEASSALLREGVTVGAALQSWTLKRMFDVKNGLVREGRERHADGELTVFSSQNDAWGTPILIQYSNGPKYVYRIGSAGPDKEFNTEDDLRLYEQPAVGRRKALPTKSQDFQSPTRSDIARTVPSDKSTRWTSHGETVVNLESLLQEN